MKNHNFQP